MLTIVFVSFYSEKKILDYLKYFNNNFKIIIVDNANDLNLEDKLQGFSILKIINNKENIGFGAALNKGLEIVKTKYEELINKNDNVYDQLVKLKELHENGVLNKEEFEKAKKKY